MINIKKILNLKSVRTVGFISVAIMLSKIMGVLRDSFVLKTYALGGINDAFTTASQIPTLFFDLCLGAAVMSTFIPVFNEIMAEKGKREAYKFASNFLNIVVIISIAFVIIGSVFASYIIHLMAPGYTPDIAMLATNLLIIILPSLIFTTIAYVFVGVLQSLDEFKIPAIISLISNLAVIIYIVFFNKFFGIYGLAVALTIAWSLQALVQVPSLIKKKFKYTFVVNFKDKNLLQAAKISIPILISAWVQPICVLINQRFASQLGEGSVTALSYANRIYILVVGVFSYAITNYIFPKLSLVKNDDSAFNKLVTTGVKSILLITLPVMIGVMLFAPLIIRILYQHGEFTADMTMITATALRFYCVGMLALGVNEVLCKAFYAHKDGKTPMISAIIGIVVNISFALILVATNHVAIWSLALAQGISSNMVMGYLWLVAYKKGYIGKTHLSEKSSEGV
ncbi:MAG: murein biosynthesis integral membrane protein MurJ [Clostridiales bacterium]|jgi:putative peptidoglycan lipid II flippase|nr:murein biosynthesis integral membrane protein MurJ [Clostridiales bacterium]